MRDIVFSAVMVVFLPLCAMHPWIGILVWSWLAYMNPHRYTWGLANWFVPWSQLVAIATIAGFLVTKDRKPFIWCRETILMFLLWLWFTITTLFAWYPEDAWWQWQRVSKILLMNFLTIPLMQDRGRLRWLLLVIAGSLGFYGLKGGLFVLATGGNYMVYGAPGGSFVSSNNAIALALNMCLPLFWYLRKDETRPWLRAALLATFCLSALAVPFTYSRGGLLGLCVVLMALFLRSRRRYLVLPLAALWLTAVFTYAPEHWVARMETIQEYEQDPSAVSRLLAWKVGRRIANDSPLVGGGFWVFNHEETYARYLPEVGPKSTDAHSIYFNLLGEHGYVGLGLFIALITSISLSLASTYRAGRRHNLPWVSDYSHMLGTGIVAYLFTGAFLSVAYFDLAWHFFAFVVLLKHLIRKELETLAPDRPGLESFVSSPHLRVSRPVSAADQGPRRPRTKPAVSARGS